MRLVNERRRDTQQWMLDWMVKTTGRVQNFAYDERQVPPEVKSYAMVPKHMGRWGMHQEAIGRAAEEAGHKHTALEAYRRAVHSYHFAQHAIYYDDDPHKLHWYQRLSECFDRIISVSSYPLERVEVSWEGHQIQCAFHLLPDRRKAPTILFIPGMDMVKELVWCHPRLALEREMNIIYMDGPGQGMSNIRKIRVTHDNYERSASAVIDYLRTRPEVDPERIGVLGMSMGSFWGVRTAAYDHSFGALATTASCLGDMTAIFEQASPRFKRIFMYMAGVHEEEEFDRTVAAHMITRGYGGKITCPTLVVQSEFDPLTPVEDAEELFDELQVPKEMWVLEDDFHGVRDHPGLGGIDVFPFVLDWLKDVLGRGLPASHSRVKWVHPKDGSGPYGE